LRREEGTSTVKHTTHLGHTHEHGPDCGHLAIRHEEHTDYVHEGHLHSPRGDHVDECKLGVTAANPADCTPSHACGEHSMGHLHGPACGHEAVPHGDHVDYLVAGHLHHAHGAHCDDHGNIVVV
jgi:hypothetical protein